MTSRLCFIRNSIAVLVSKLVSKILTAAVVAWQKESGATLKKNLDSIKRNLFWVSTSQNLSVFLLQRIVRFIFQGHKLVQWDKCPGLCTCPTLVATCPRQVNVKP